MTDRCGVYELRRYALVPGRRDDLIELFDRCFVDSQEELGIRVVGHFRLRGDPDVFVWIRGFPDMESRARSLQAFYGESAAWRENRDAANATMIAFDDVLLLRPAGRAPSFALAPAERPGPDAPETDGGRIVAEISRFERTVGEDPVAAFESKAIPVLRSNGVDPQALLVTEPAADIWTFPIETVAKSERGLDRTRQGESFTLRWPVEIGTATIEIPATPAQSLEPAVAAKTGSGLT